MANVKLNEIYEDLNEGIRNENFSHSEVLSMFLDFLDDTLVLQTEFEMSPHDIEIFHKAQKALVLAALVKLNYERNG